MQRNRSKSQRIISPVAITALVLLAPLCTPVGEAATLSQRDVVYVTQARAQALVRSVSAAARRWRHDNLPAPTWVCPSRAPFASTFKPAANHKYALQADKLIPAAPRLELHLDLPPPFVHTYLSNS